MRNGGVSWDHAFVQAEATVSFGIPAMVIALAKGGLFNPCWLRPTNGVGQGWSIQIVIFRRLCFLSTAGQACC
jgi:hypothetical protein